MSGTEFGYGSREYCESLADFGRPLELAACGGWILERAIPDSGLTDAMGPYPLFACRDWARIGDDFRTCERNLVSVVLVTDPFHAPSASDLQREFDVVKPFKEHLVVDLGRPVDQIGSRHHRYYGRRARREIEVVPSTDPVGFSESWTSLYGELVRRRGLTGIKAFSAAAFRRQLAVPGAVLLVACRGSELVGAQIWMVAGRVAYSHLTAMSAAGYDSRASYAIYAAAIDHFRGIVDFLDLGGGAGLADSAQHLVEFKRGWSTGARMAYLCGRILDRDGYRLLAGDRQTDYFPAYRAGELA